MKHFKLFLLALAMTAMPQAINAQAQTNAQTTAADLDAKYATELLKPGTEAPEIALNTIDGKQFSLKSLRGKYVVLDFWASWCGPCRVLGPTVEEVAEEYADKAIVAKCNVDDCEDISMKYGIRNIPTLVFIKNGEVVDRTVGVVSKQDITSRIEKLL